jgi:tyrosyl-tRNA synthetase
LNNYIGIEEPPDQMFGKIMSISDDLMWRYYELLTDTTIDDINAWKFKCESGAENPRNLKVQLAKLIIADFHSDQAAEKAEEEFNRRFVKKEVPDEIEEIKVSAGTHVLAQLIADVGLAGIERRSASINSAGRCEGEWRESVRGGCRHYGEGVLLQVGKLKFLKVRGGK